MPAVIVESKLFRDIDNTPLDRWIITGIVNNFITDKEFPSSSSRNIGIDFYDRTEFLFHRVSEEIFDKLEEISEYTNSLDGLYCVYMKKLGPTSMLLHFGEYLM